MKLDLDADPSLPPGWRIVRHLRQGSFEWNAARVRLHVDPTQRRGRMAEGRELARIIEGMAACNATLLDHLLRRPRLIPAAWRGKTAEDSPYIQFWGTHFRDPGNIYCVRSLHWDGDRWGWCSQWVGSLFLENDPALVFRRR